jgi:ADP-ribosylarginine hydrolase
MSEDRYIATIVLHALGDTIGYRNAEWEFMKASNVADKILEKVYEFIDFGGINYVPQIGWNVSDDTIMHICVINSLLCDYVNLDDFCNNLVKQFISAFEKEFSTNEGLYKRQPGSTLLESLKRLLEDPTWNGMEYEYYAGGSGASMRSSCIGLAFSGLENRSKLIEYSIESSRITHNSATGYLGGMVAALFTAFAIEDIKIREWPFLLLDIFKKNIIDDYIKLSGRDYDNFTKDVHTFIGKWTVYINDKFDDNGDPIKRRSSKNLVYRTQYYYDNFKFQEEKSVFFPGGGGDDSVIISYDCLIDAGNNWEKLVFYAMLHGGDTDTTGCIAASWYGALYGFNDVPKNSINVIEYRDELYNLGQKLYKKYKK